MTFYNKTNFENTRHHTLREDVYQEPTKSLVALCHSVIVVADVVDRIVSVIIVIVFVIAVIVVKKC